MGDIVHVDWVGVSHQASDCSHSKREVRPKFGKSTIRRSISQDDSIDIQPRCD